MQQYKKRLPPQSKKQQTPGRIELKHKPRTMKNLFFRLFLAIAVYVLISEVLIFVNKWPRDSVYLILGLILAIFVVPGAAQAFFEEFTKTVKDPARRIEKENRIRNREEQRRAEQAEKAAANAPGELDDEGILGGAYAGTLSWIVGPYATLPDNELAKHGVIIGGSGSGKTVSLFRLAYIAMNFYGYRVYFIDGKGDRQTAAEFTALMRYLDGEPHMFPRQAFNGWKGDGTAILNRLMAILDFSEPYYEDAARDTLTTACLNHPDGPPRSSTDLLKRLNLMLAADPRSRTLEGAVLRYRSFFGALQGTLDNGFSWEDTNAAYILLDGLALKKQAASLGRFLIEDFAHYAARRKGKGRDLLIIDEFSAISDGTDAANLIERIRSYGCAVVLSSQSYAGLGKERDAERILDAANFLMLHRTAAPEQLTRRAGTAEVEHASYQITDDIKTHGATRLTTEEEDAVHPDEARRLKTGEALLIAHGSYLRLRVAQPPPPSAGTVDEALRWINEAPDQAKTSGQEQTPAQSDGQPEPVEEAGTLHNTQQPQSQERSTRPELL